MDTRRTGEAERMAALAENRYGKSRIRLVRVKRHRDGHEFREWAVQILLRGEFESCFKEGDNSKILPTDTLKNTVYSLARDSSAACVEDFGKELVDFLLRRNSQVSEAEASISEKAWEHVVTGGKRQPTTFVQSGNERQTARVARAQGGNFLVTSGIEDLVILKTAGSGFEGYVKDSLTTLPPTADRLFGTALRAEWKYARDDFAFPTLRTRIRDILLSVFAAHESKSVQHTLYAMGEAVLAGVSEIDEIDMTMPNLHCVLVDLARFGQDNPNEIFVPTDEPAGHIEARVRRTA